MWFVSLLCSTAIKEWLSTTDDQSISRSQSNVAAHLLCNYKLHIRFVRNGQSFKKFEKENKHTRLYTSCETSLKYFYSL